MTRILLVDDQALLCEVLQTWLEVEKDFQVVGRAHNGQTAIAQVEILEPDIVLMDIEMPKMNGIKATHIIRKRFPRTKIIILSAIYNETYLSLALRAGAQGYLLKDTQAGELANTIRFVDRGYNQIEPRLLRKIITPIRASNALDSEPENFLLQEEKDAALEFFNSPSPNNSAVSPSKAHINKEKSVLSTPTVNKIAKTKRINNFILLWSGAIVLLLGLLILLSGGLGYNWLSGLQNQSKREAKSKESRSENILPVQAIAVYPVNSYQESRIYTGTINARRTSELGFEHSGQLTRIVVDEGESVSAGTPLAYLDSQNLEAERRELLAQRSQAVAQLKEMLAGSRTETIASARASVRDVREQLELARRKSRRREELYAQGAISREQLDEAISGQSVLQARLDKAKSELDELLAGTRPERIEAQKSVIKQYDANLAKLQLQFQKNVLKAPFAAIISRQLIDEGTIVSAGQAVLRLVENKAPEVRIGVPVTAADQIAVGSYQQLEIGKKFYQAQLLSILPELNSSTRTLTVVLKLNESIGADISPGQIARLKLVQTITNSGYWLPVTGLVQGIRGLWSCYVLSKPTTDGSNTFVVERKDVEILYTQSDRVLVRGTLQPGDRVIISGTHRLVPGQLVRPVVATSSLF